MFYFVVIVQTAINTGVSIGTILLAADCIEVRRRLQELLNLTRISIIIFEFVYCGHSLFVCCKFNQTFRILFAFVCCSQEVN